MNLLDDPWIPVHEHGERRDIDLASLLTQDTPRALALARDDMEAAALQLLIALTQTLFTPADGAAYRRRLRTPLTLAEYRATVRDYRHWFELFHPQTPFLQTRGVPASEPTPIQKLFVGLPAGITQTFLNPVDAIRHVCPRCAAIALFNQASAAPSFGGGFKNPLRGNGPITTLLAGHDLRATIWLNVLTRDTVRQHYPQATDPLAPTWIDPLRRQATYRAAEIGLCRGLFWQPNHIELLPTAAGGCCEACQGDSPRLIPAFNKAPFTFNVEGLWLHPHSPQQWDLHQGAPVRVRYRTFNSSAPTWHQLNHFLLAASTNQPALVVQQGQTELPETLQIRLLVSGYRTRQSLVLERRHELFTLPLRWPDHAGTRQLEAGLTFAQAVRQILRGQVYYASKQLYYASKQLGAPLLNAVEQQFDHGSRALVDALFTEMTRHERQQAMLAFNDAVIRLAYALFEQTVAPYHHTVRGIAACAPIRANLRRKLAALPPGEPHDGR